MRPQTKLASTGGETWCQWLRTNFDKFLLFVALQLLLMFLLHASHDKADKEIVAFAREITGQILAALLTLVTLGRSHANRHPTRCRCCGGDDDAPDQVDESKVDAEGLGDNQCQQKQN